MQVMQEWNGLSQASNEDQTPARREMARWESERERDA